MLMIQLQLSRIVIPYANLKTYEMTHLNKQKSK